MSLLFVHIAKTGGTSFRRLLKSNKQFVLIVSIMALFSVSLMDIVLKELMLTSMRWINMMLLLLLSGILCLACRVLITIFCRAV